MVILSLPVAKSVLAARGFLKAHWRSTPCFLSKLLASIREAVVWPNDGLSNEPMLTLGMF